MEKDKLFNLKNELEQVKSSKDKIKKRLCKELVNKKDLIDKMKTKLDPDIPVKRKKAKEKRKEAAEKREKIKELKSSVEQKQLQIKDFNKLAQDKTSEAIQIVEENEDNEVKTLKQYKKALYKAERKRAKADNMKTDNDSNEEASDVEERVKKLFLLISEGIKHAKYIEQKSDTLIGDTEKLETKASELQEDTSEFIGIINILKEEAEALEDGAKILEDEVTDLERACGASEIDIRTLQHGYEMAEKEGNKQIQERDEVIENLKMDIREVDGTKEKLLQRLKLEHLFGQKDKKFSNEFYNKLALFLELPRSSLEDLSKYYAPISKQPVKPFMASKKGEEVREKENKGAGTEPNQVLYMKQISDIKDQISVKKEGIKHFEELAEISQGRKKEFDEIAWLKKQKLAQTKKEFEQQIEDLSKKYIEASDVEELRERVSEKEILRDKCIELINKNIKSYEDSSSKAEEEIKKYNEEINILNKEIKELEGTLQRLEEEIKTENKEYESFIKNAVSNFLEGKDDDMESITPEMAEAQEENDKFQEDEEDDIRKAIEISLQEAEINKQEEKDLQLAIAMSLSGDNTQELPDTGGSSSSGLAGLPSEIFSPE